MELTFLETIMKMWILGLFWLLFLVFLDDFGRAAHSKMSCPTCFWHLEQKMWFGSNIQELHYKIFNPPHFNYLIVI